MAEEKNLRKYFFIGIVLIIAILAYFVVRSFLIPITTGVILAYLLFPVYKFLTKKLKPGLASFITVILMALIIIIPFFFIIQSLILQVSYLITDANIELVTKTISDFLRDNPTIETYLPDILTKAGNWIVDNLWSIVSYLPKLLFDAFIVLFVAFYVFIDGKRVLEKVKKLLPFKNKDEAIKGIGKVTNQIVYGFLLIALIELIIAAIGFKLAGVTLWLLFAFIIAVAAFIPMLGPMAVWVPTAIYFLIQQNWISFTIILITGVILTYLIDTLLRVKIVEKKTRIHPVVLLIGILGGVAIFGFIGLFAGPLIIAILIKLIEAAVKK